MLRMKSRKRTKKMRGGGIFGPEFGGHVSKAGEDAKKGWFHFTTGLKKGKEVGQQARYDATRGYNENIKPSDTMGGVKSTQPKVDISDTLRQLAIKRRTRKRHGEMGFGVAKQIQARDMGLSDPAKSNPFFSPMKSIPREKAFAARTKALATEASTSDVPNPIKFQRQGSKGGKRKTKKRRKRKKKKTKRKKRRRKRKTKKRKRRR